MALNREQKQKILEDLGEKLRKQKAIFLVDFTGLKVKDFSNLRKKIKSIGDELKVVKKTLIDIVFKKAKIDIEPKKIPGEIALVFAYKDEIRPAKIIYQFSKENENFKILGGFFDGKFREAKDIISLAQLPSREELIANLFFTVKSPLLVLYNIFQQNLNILKVRK